MAEIILTPTAQSKVIPLSLRLNDTDTSLVSQLVTNRQFNTADTDAWFSFTLEGLAATTGTFDLTLINLQDKSVFNHTDKVFNTNPFYYKLDSGTDELTNEIRHAGKWVGQLVVTLANGDSATRKFIFGIEGHILDGTVVQTILLEDYNTLIASIESAKDELTQYNIDYSTLISTVESQEAARVQAELTREQTFTALVDSEMIAQNVATKLAEKEATFAPRLLSVESELAQMMYQIDSFTGSTDNEKIVNAFAFMNGLDKEGATLFFPSRKTPYKLTDSVTANGKWNIKMDKEIEYNGTGVALTVKDASRRTIDIMIKKGVNYGGWFNGIDLTSVGVQFDNVNWCEVHLKDVRGFHTNILFDNSDMRGSCYNNVSLGIIYDSFNNIHLKYRYVSGTTTSWNNQNQFFGGAIKNSGVYTPAKPNSCLVRNEGNNNTFVGVCLEGGNMEYSILTTGSYNLYLNCRYELNPPDSLRFTAKSSFNQVIGGFQLDDKNVSYDSVVNVTVFSGGSLTNLYTQNANANPALSLSSYTDAQKTLLQLGTRDRETIKVNGLGKISLYHDVSGEYPQIEMQGRNGTLSMGHGTAPTKTIVDLDGNPDNDLISFKNFNFEYKKTTSHNYEPITATITDTIIDIRKGNVFKTNNTTPTSIKYPTGGREGKPIYLYCGDDFTTIEHTSQIKLKTGVTRKMQIGEVIHFIKIMGILVEC